MTDEELLEEAQKLLGLSNGPGITTDQVMGAAQSSIAASLLVIARNSVRQEVDVPEQTDLSALRQDAINEEVGSRVAGYRQYWNAETGKFEIDKGTKDEWICTEDELYDDVRKSVEDEFETVGNAS